MRKNLLVITLLVSLASSGLFSDLLKTLMKSETPSITKLIKGLPSDFLQELETNEQQAGQFVCAIVAGKLPGALADLETDIATDVWSDIQPGIADLTSFIAALPTVAPEILDTILSDGEDALSVIEDIFTNLGGALTLVEGDAATVLSDVESVVTNIWHGWTCWLGGGCSDSLTSINPAATLSSSCSNVMAAATTTYSATGQAAASSTSYPAATPSSNASPAIAAQTSTMGVDVQATETLDAETWTTAEGYVTATTTSSVAQNAPPQGGNRTGSGNESSKIPSDGVQVFTTQSLVGFLASLVVFAVVL